MLKTRVLTAFIIAPLAFGLIFLAPVELFRTAISALWLLASLEYARLAALGRAATVGLVLVQAAVFLLLFNFWGTVSQLSLSLLMAACLTWCLMLLRLVNFHAGQPPPFGYSILGFACAVASMSFAWIALAVMRDLPQGEFWILCLLIIVWAADIGAYFAGRRFGGRQLAPSISPAKTWAGLWGGLGLAVIAALALTQLAPWYRVDPLTIAVLSAATMLASAGGDLFISLQKRTVGIKDTGHLLPGHGGLLDRFDSLIAAAPFFALGMLLFVD